MRQGAKATQKEKSLAELFAHIKIIMFAMKRNKDVKKKIDRKCGMSSW